jgi:hypothetical protein
MLLRAPLPFDGTFHRACHRGQPLLVPIVCIVETRVTGRAGRMLQARALPRGSD